jgi:hypothetical protein
MCRRSLSIPALRYFEGLTTSLMPARRGAPVQHRDIPRKRALIIRLWPSAGRASCSAGPPIAHFIRWNSPVGVVSTGHRL